MEWKKEYSSGIPEIDRDHHILVQLLTDVEEAAAKGRGAPAIFAAIEQLMNMTKAHFDLDVATMRMRGYPKLEEHVSAHKAFLAELGELEVRTFGGAAWTESLGFLRGWLDQHLLSFDKEYALFIKSGHP